MTFRRVFTHAYRSYKQTSHNAFSRKYLLYTNIMLSATISCCGDLLEQSYEYHTKTINKFDFARTAHMSFSGSIAGVICHNWYIILDKVIVGRTVKMALKKLMMDQFICSPIVILSFFATVAMFEDNPLENFTEEVSEKFWILYKAEWVVWPPAQLINFYFLPTRFRVLYDNSISLCYDIYTSRVKHMKIEKGDPQKKNIEVCPSNETKIESETQLNDAVSSKNNDTVDSELER